MVYTKKMILQTLSIMNVLVFVSLTEAMDKKPETRSEGKWNNSAPVVLKDAEQQKKDRKDNPIKQDTAPLARYVEHNSQSHDVLPHVGNTWEDSQNFRIAQQELRAKVQREENECLAKLQKQQKRKDNAAASKALANQQSSLKQQERALDLAQFDTKQDFFAVESTTKKKSSRSSRRPSHKNYSNPAVPVLALPGALTQIDFVFQGANAMELDSSCGQFDNGFAHLTPPASPKRSEMNDAMVLRSNGYWTPSATKNLNNAQDAGQKNLTGLNRDVRKAQEKHSLKPLQLEYASEEDN